VFTTLSLYIWCFAGGVAYGLIVGFFSGILGGDHDIGGGHDIDMDPGDLGDMGGAGIHFSPLSPAVISTFLTVFGGAGIICIQVFDIDPLISILPSTIVAICCGVAVFKVFDYVFTKTQGGVEVNLAQLIGRDAEVIISIPKDGMGEIAFNTSGGRTNTAARSATGKAIPKSSIVRITRIVGSVYLVEPISNDAPAKADKAASKDSDS
jgi:hypothetical protein